MANQPIFILPEGTERYSKRDALRMNITAAKVLSGIVRTTLGPKGINVILDRYMYSNLAHQGGKIKNKKDREEMYSWLNKLEFDLQGC